MTSRGPVWRWKINSIEIKTLRSGGPTDIRNVASKRAEVVECGGFSDFVTLEGRAWYDRTASSATSEEQ